MKALKTLFVMRLKVQLQYGWAAIAGVFTQLFFGFVMVMVYIAFFESTNKPMPMSLEETITYVWLGQALLGLLPWNGDREVQKMIRDGNVVYELVRPLSLYRYWYFKMLATRIGNTTLRAIPLWLILMFIPQIYQPQGPADMKSLVAFAIAMVGAVFLGVTITNIITISTLLTIGDGLDRLFPAIVTLCSGLVIPLAYFPDWAVRLLKLLPFAGLTDLPYQFYMGRLAFEQLPYVILHQWTWTVIMALIGQGILWHAKKRIVVQGG